MMKYSHADKLHRLVKHALDSGAAKSLDDAKALFDGYRLHINMDERDAANYNNQVALLTAVALGRRVFLGGVTVTLPPNVTSKTRLCASATLAEAVVELGGAVGSLGQTQCFIAIGNSRNAISTGFGVRTVFRGWRGGIVPLSAEDADSDPDAMPLAAMLSAALAVSEAYQFVSGSSAFAGKRPVGLSLWDIENPEWLSAQMNEPTLRLLPKKLWLIGLGHLGQAYMWALSLLPYRLSDEPLLALQDFDLITPSTESTSILSDAKLVGMKKTRTVASWAERRGFETQIVERLFDATTKRHTDEPGIALCGLDNALGRQALDRAGFDFVVEAGLGRGHQDFSSIALHTLPGSRTASDIWKLAANKGETLVAPAYVNLLKNGVVDQCGMTLLAGRAVGAPFVGAVAACLVIAEVLRLLEGRRPFEVIDINLKALEHRVAVQNHKDFNHLNPGFIRI